MGAAESGVRHLQASSASDPETARGEGDSPSSSPSPHPARLQRGCPASQHPGVGLSASRTVREYISVILSHPVYGHFYGNPEKPVPGRRRNRKPRSSMLAGLWGVLCPVTELSRQKTGQGLRPPSPHSTTRSLGDLGLVPGNTYLYDVVHAGPCLRVVWRVN